MAFRVGGQIQIHLHLHRFQTLGVGLGRLIGKFALQSHRDSLYRVAFLIGDSDGITGLGRLSLLVFLSIAFFQNQFKTERTGNDHIIFVPVNRNAELDLVALLYLYRYGSISVFIGDTVIARIPHRVGTEVIQIEAVFAHAGMQAANGQSAVFRYGINTEYAFFVSGAGLHVKLTQGQFVRIAYRALQCAKGDGKFLLFIGRVTKNNLYWIKSTLGFHQHPHVAGGRVGLLAVIDHIEVRAGHIHVQAGGFEEVHVELLSGLQGNFCAGCALLVRMLRCTNGLILLVRRQFIQALHHTGNIVIGGKVLENLLEGIGIVDAAGMHQRDHAGAVNHHSSGIGRQLQHICPGRICHRHREIQFQLALESSNIPLVIIHRVHGDQPNIPRELGIGLIHIGELCSAGIALDIPEVQYHRLLALKHLRQFVLVAVGIHHGEITDGITQLVAHILRVQVLNGSCFQHKQVFLAGYGVHLLSKVTGGHIGKHRVAVAVLHGCCEGDHAVGVGLIEPGKLCLLLILIHIDADALQRRAALCSYLDGKGPGLTLMGIRFRRIPAIRLFAANNRQRKSCHQQDRQDNRQNFFHLCHRVLLSGRGSLLIRSG